MGQTTLSRGPQGERQQQYMTYEDEQREGEPPDFPPTSQPKVIGGEERTWFPSSLVVGGFFDVHGLKICGLHPPSFRLLQE